MRGDPVRPIVIAAGGTGGHFFPAEALAGALIGRGNRVVLMTDARSGNLASSVFAEREAFVIRGAGIAGRGPARAAGAAASLAVGVAQARKILGRMDAAAIVGFGGYPSVAPILAARMLARRPALILHEQNAVLGRANRFLARACDTLALSLAQTVRVPGGVKTIVTGNPIRAAIAALSNLSYTPPADAIELLVLGGSLGARVFSDVVPPAIAALPAGLRARMRITQQCRAEDVDRVRAAYAAMGVNATVDTFFKNIENLLGYAHLVIARAGASTVFELAAAGRPSILVPLPGAIDDHQIANAAALAANGAAIVMPQPGFTAASLAHNLERHLQDAPGLSAAAAAARTHARADAAARLADLVEAHILQDARLLKEIGR